MQKEDIKLIEILLVEDNPADVCLILEALKDRKLQNHISVVKDGVRAIAFLKHQGDYTDAPRPNLIILDLNLPKKNGREVLAEIKEDPVLKRIPVVVLTGSKAEEDVVSSYNLHANCYVSKPLDFESFIKIVKSIEDFWFTIVMLPK